MNKNASSKHNKQLFWYGLVIVGLCLAGIFYVRLQETPLEHAISLIKQQKAAAALVILEDIGKKNPENVEVLPWLSLAYLQVGRLAEGRVALDTAVKVKLPCQVVVPVVRSFSRYYQQQQDYKEAERLLNLVQGSCKSAEYKRTKCEFLSSWADYEIFNNSLDEATGHLAEAISLSCDKNDKEKLTHSLADCYRKLALNIEKENESKAVELLLKSLAVADEPATRMLLGDILASSNKPQLAVEHFQALVKMDPNNLEARHKLIDLYLKMDNLVDAQQVLLELVEKEKSIENYQLLSSICMKLRNYASAVRNLEEARTLNPDNIEILLQLNESLLDWANELTAHNKIEEAASVKNKADRITDTIETLNKLALAKNNAQDNLEQCPIALSKSRIWLSRGSLTPEGEIQIKNISNASIVELTLKMSFFDNTTHKLIGTVRLFIANPNYPIDPGQSRSLYFSSPDIVKTEHMLCLRIFWKEQLIRELPVVKEY